MTYHLDDVPLLRAALAVACDGHIHESALDPETAAALRRWLPSPHGPAGGAYWLAADVEALLAGCDPS
jgi:hypothetical protein